ncbi:MAG: peptide-methionine (R)-S-oxide reductase MsrB [Pseudomonadota bacterium]
MKHKINRRTLLSGGVSLVALAAFLPMLKISRGFADHGAIEKISRSKIDWKKQLTDQEYKVLRKNGTEPAYSSALDKETREGTYLCKGCDLPLFKSETKYDSGTGWPSFYDVIDGHIETKLDFVLFIPRTEYHCARCGGHQGHVFKDGPPPTGLRYCNNGVALKFQPA